MAFGCTELDGNTPAYAGKTTSFFQLVLNALETPPLTRGRPVVRAQREARRGNTPAYAGKTAESGDGGERYWKHPRLRGEDHRPARSVPCLLGNTPAYAGKTRRLVCTGRRLGKHPRLRGEDLYEIPELIRAAETPPLTRGRRTQRDGTAVPVGNTPAYAGKTTTGTSFVFFIRKHPRLRGEDLPGPGTETAPAETPPLTRGRLLQEGIMSGGWETPPLTRGRLGVGCARDVRPGNTPAYAGKTSSPVARKTVLMETPPLTRGRPIAS